VRTTIPFHQAILRNERFLAGAVSTRFLESLAEEPAAALAAVS
jgi:biotin carboxylase